MKRLYNRVNRAELKKKLEDSHELRTTLSFYRYHQLGDPASFRDELYAGLDRLGVFGRIYIASEGINGQISVPTETFDDFKSYLYDDDLSFLGKLFLFSRSFYSSIIFILFALSSGLDLFS